MPVEPLPCAPGGGDSVEVTTCCAPAIATGAMCTPDGTPVLLVVRSGCTECGAAAPDPQAVGWIDPATGVFTPGAPPAGTGPCDAGCVTTVCVQRCDDTDGDGAADVTYSELWCVRADGTTELVLTYGPDVSQPYTPVAPVECIHGTVECHTAELCDDNGPFLRRWTFVSDGTATYVDVALDGQTPHLVTGPVRACGAPPCEEPTTPTATVGLCLPDGTPIAVVLTRDCAGTVTQDGWIHLPTGAWSTGAPPPGAAACGDSRAFELAGLLCDTDPATGDVLGLVLVEYAYAADGSLASVRLVDPATGTTYVLQGELRNCPADGAGLPDSDLAVLCDTAPDGTVTAFIRDYRRDPVSGLVTGHTDYTLDGDPYSVAGTVGTCVADAAVDVETWPLCVINTDGSVLQHVRAEQVYDAQGQAVGFPRIVDAVTGGPVAIPGGASLGVCPGEPCRDSSFTLLCDVAALDTVTVFDPANVQGADGWQITSYTDGGCTGGNGPEGPVPGPAVWSAGGFLGIRADRQLGTTSCAGWNGYDAAPIRWVITKTFAAPEDGAAVITADAFRGDGGARVRVNGQDVGLYGQWNQPAVGGSTQVPITAGPNVIEIEVRDVGGPNWVTGRLDVVMTRTQQFMRRTVTDCETGTVVSVTDTTLDGQPYTVTGTVGECQPAAECCEQPPPETRLDVETGLLCIRDPATGETLGQVLVELVYDDQTGERVEHRLTDPTTGAPVTLPPGAVVTQCPPPEPEPCRNTSTLLVCDLPGDGTPDPTVTDTDPGPYDAGTAGADPVAGGAAALWSGGVLTIPPDTGPSADGSVQRLRTFAATVAAVRPGCDTGTATVTASIRVERTGPDPGCAGTGILALVAGGSVLSTAGVTPASAPVGTVRVLTVSGTVPAADLAAGTVAVVGRLETYHIAPGSCPGTGPGGARVGGWTVDDSTVTIDYDQAGCAEQVFANVVTDCETGAVESVTYTLPDGTPYEPQGTIGQCTPAGGPAPLPEPCRTASTLLLCDSPALAPDAGAVASADTDPTPYTPQSWPPASRPIADGTALWAGGTLTLGPDPAGPGGHPVHRFTAAALTGAAAPCPNAVPTLTVTVHTRLDGPTAGEGITGGLRLLDATATDPRSTPVARVNLPANPPVGWEGDLTVTAEVDPALLAAGAYVAMLSPETHHAGEHAWTLSGYTATVTWDTVPCATRFVRTLLLDCDTGAVVTTTDTTLDGTPYTPGGQVTDCGPTAETDGCPAHTVLTAERCDDTDGDGIGDTPYAELLAVDCAGRITPLSTWTPDLAEPYEPVAPVAAGDEEPEGAPAATGARAHRVELAPGQSWTLTTAMRVQSVTATAHSGTGTITTTDGTSTLHTSESATWSLIRPDDALLAGPLTITATGTVSVAWTQGVTL